MALFHGLRRRLARRYCQYDNSDKQFAQVFAQYCAFSGETAQAIAGFASSDGRRLQVSPGVKLEESRVEELIWKELLGEGTSAALAI